MREGPQRDEGGALYGAKWIIVFIVTLQNCFIVRVKGLFSGVIPKTFMKTCFVIYTRIMNFVICKKCVNGKTSETLKD